MRDWMDDGAPVVHVLSKRVVTACKHHESSCGPRCQGILPGQRYECVALLEDGEFHLLKYHKTAADCPVAMQLLKDMSE